MKQLQRVVQATLLLFMSALGAPCFGPDVMAAQKATIEDVQKETQEFLRVLKSYTVAQREEAVMKAREVLSDLDLEIEALEEQVNEHWATMSKAARAEAQASLKALRKQRNAVAEEYGRLRESSADGWEQMKKGFAQAFGDLQQAWEKAKKEFDTNK